MTATAATPSPTRVSTVATELALTSVTLATGLAFSRLFIEGGFLVPVLLAASFSHAAAAAMRRAGWTIVRSAAASFLGLVLTVTWLRYLDTTAFGLPTFATADALRLDADQAWATFQDVVAPSPVEPGFVVALMVALWAAAFLADWAAFRLWSPVEAVVPGCALFIFASLLGAAQDEVLLTTIFVATVMLFELLHHVTKQITTRHWINAQAARGNRTLVAGGALMGALAVGAAALVGPALPGADDTPVVEWRDIGDDSPARVTVSPMVSIRSQLVQQADVEVFTVEADRPAYWRLTALDTFDGTIWKSSGSFEDVDGVLPRGGPALQGEQSLSQRFEIEALSSLWLPVAFEPIEVDTDGVDLVYEADTSTVIVSNERSSSDGLTYDAVSVDPEVDEATLNQIGPVPEAIAARFLSLPADYDPALTEQARQLTAAGATPYQQSLLLQDYFRSQFTYNDQVELDHDIDSIEEFLRIKEGYCEQFAGTFAAFARSIGIPARVAVGFTWGDQDAEDPRLFRVTGRHAHAWPEVWLPGAGWVPFEPTPSRGNPLAQDITRVPAAQAAPREGVDPPSSSTTTAGGSPTTTTPRTQPTRPDGSLETERDTPTAVAAADERNPLSRLLLPVAMVLAALALYAVVVILMHRLLRRRQVDALLRSVGRRGDSEADLLLSRRARLAWFDAAQHLATAGLVRRPTETAHEFARRVLNCTDLAAETITGLATLEVAATYGTHPPTEAAVLGAEEHVGTIAAWVRAHTSLRDRLRATLDPRPLLPTGQRVVGPGALATER
jgi:transglutaminase-like putative cysteine protease